MDRDHRDDGSRPHKKSKTEKRNEKKAAMTKGAPKESKGKGKGLGKPPGCAAQTPDGTKICFDFNTKGVTCRRGASCPFAHCCGKCFAKGTPIYECTRCT